MEDPKNKADTQPSATPPTPAGQQPPTPPETPPADNKVKDLEKQLQDANTRNATLEQRVRELDQQGPPQGQQLPANQFPTLEERTKKLADLVLDDPGSFSTELSKTLRDVQQETLFQAQALMSGNLAMSDVIEKNPDLKPFERVINAKADEIMYRSPGKTYQQALHEAAGEVNNTLNGIVEARKGGQVQPPPVQPPPEGGSVQGVMSHGVQIRGETPPEEQQTIQQELESRNQTLFNKYI